MHRTALSASSLLLIASLALAGCAGLPFQRDDAPDGPAETDLPVSVMVAPDDDVARPAPRPESRIAARDGADAAPTDASDRRIATGGLLGETLAGLGAPSEGGMWLRTGLVDETRQGRVESEGGATVAVELRPSGREPGSGSQLSFEAMQALNLPLTRLATLQVFAGR